jgi:hypothetical protein
MPEDERHTNRKCGSPGITVRIEAGKRRGCRRRRSGSVATLLGGVKMVTASRGVASVASSRGGSRASSHSSAARSSTNAPCAPQVATRAEKIRSGCGGHSGESSAGVRVAPHPPVSHSMSRASITRPQIRRPYPRAPGAGFP